MPATFCCKYRCMENSPWKDIDDAFEMMYDESIVVKHSNETATVEVCIFTDNTGDSLADETMDTTREDIKIACKREDWPYMSRLVRGDTIERTAYNGLKYKVQEAKFDALMGWCIYARSI